jgi:hypothetical protein
MDVHRGGLLFLPLTNAKIRQAADGRFDRTGKEVRRFILVLDQ